MGWRAPPGREGRGRARARARAKRHDDEIGDEPAGVSGSGVSMPDQQLPGAACQADRDHPSWSGCTAAGGWCVCVCVCVRWGVAQR